MLLKMLIMAVLSIIATHHTKEDQLEILEQRLTYLKDTLNNGLEYIPHEGPPHNLDIHELIAYLEEKISVLKVE